MRAAKHGGRFWEHEKPIMIDEDGESAGEFETEMKIRTARSKDRDEIRNGGVGIAS
jgi:hypothetical protein